MTVSKHMNLEKAVVYQMSLLSTRQPVEWFGIKC